MDGEIKSRPSTPAYREGWDRIFGAYLNNECNTERNTGKDDILDLGWKAGV